MPAPLAIVGVGLGRPSHVPRATVSSEIQYTARRMSNQGTSLTYRFSDLSANPSLDILYLDLLALCSLNGNTF